MEPFEKSIGREGSSESNQIASVQPPPAEIQGEQNGDVITDTLYILNHLPILIIIIIIFIMVVIILILLLYSITGLKGSAGPCFSKVPYLFGPNSPHIFATPRF